MKNVLTDRQIFFVIFSILTVDSFINLPQIAIKASGSGVWFSIVLITIIFIFAIFIFVSLNKKFEEKTLFEYSKLIIGKTGAYIITSFYTLNFLIAACVIIRDVINFITGTFLIKTPPWALILLFLSLTAYALSKGITNIARLCEIFGLILIVVILCVHTSMFFLGDIKYIEPFFNVKQINKYIFGAKDLIFPFLGIEVLSIIPLNKKTNKRTTLYCVLSVLFVGLIYIFTVETSVMIVGINDILMYNDSLVEALRETKLPSIFVIERVDFLFLTAGIMGIIAGYFVLGCLVLNNLKSIFIKVDRKILLLSVCLIIFIVSTFFLDADSVMYFSTLIIPVSGIFTAILIPITLIIIAKVRKL